MAATKNHLTFLHGCLFLLLVKSTFGDLSSTIMYNKELTYFKDWEFYDIGLGPVNHTYDDPCTQHLFGKLCCESCNDLSRLKDNGLLKELPRDGGSVIIVNSSSMPFLIPPYLKTRPYWLWTPKEKIWLNISYTPWPEDPYCEEYSVELSTKKVLPMIALASFPRSGNTWARYLIHGATGIFTGSFYNNGCMTSQRYFGDAMPINSGTTCLIKSHGYFATPQTNKRDKTYRPEETDYQMKMTRRTGIVLIRNPFKVLYSMRNYNAMGFYGHADVTDFTGTDWENFVRISIQLWEQFYIEWLTNGQNILVVFYEAFTKENNLIPTIERMMKFMNFTLDKDRLDCVSKHRKGNFYQGAKCIGKAQEQGIEDNQYIYSKKLMRWINAAIRKVQKAIKDRGLDGTHMHTYENTNVELKYCS